jgi:hypothetical protein
MRIRPLVGALALAHLCASVARADSPEACFDAAVAGQEQRDAGKLLAARASFIACAKSTCPDEVQKDCARWLGEVEASLPTIVFGARDDGDHDLLDVRVTIDDAPAGDTAHGKPIPLDPGTHRVEFARDGSPPVKQVLVVRAGEKNRSVVAVFASPVRDSHVPTASWVLAGVGVVGLGVFAYFGAQGLSDYRRFGCDQGCTASNKSKVDTQFRVADVGLVIGIGALAAATVVWIVRPREDKPSVALTVMPTPHGSFGALDVQF